MSGRLDLPRIEPVDDLGWDAVASDIPRDPTRPGANVIATVARHPVLLRRWLAFGRHMADTVLPARERELVILRVGWNCRAEYEWAQHAIFGREAGLSDDEIRRIADGPDAPGWNDLERALLRAADELWTDAMVSDATWRALASRLGTEELLDVLFVAGHYTMISMVLNSVGVRIEDGVPGFPD